MPSFPLLNLPNLSLKNVLLQLPATDTIEFSLCSLKCQQIVKSIKYPFTGIDINMGHTKNFMLRIGDNRCFQWSFLLKPLPRGKHADKNELRTIGGMEIRVKKAECNQIYSTKTPESQVKVVYDFLKELFKVPVYDFGFLNNECKKLLPHHFGVTKSAIMWIYSDNHIPDEHIQYVIKDVEISKKLYLTIEGNPDFRCDSARFKMDELTIHHAQWVTRDTFLSLDCARITIERANITRKDIEDFIEHWWNSDNTRLQYLIINRNWQMERVDLRKFQAKLWDPTVRGGCFGLNEWNCVANHVLDCSGGMDIIRNDGLMATILEKSAKLYFVVWHNRFPSDTFPIWNRVI